jgi:hypothetical protein
MNFDQQQRTYQITGMNFDLQPIPRLELYLYQAKLEISIAERGPFLYFHRGQLKFIINLLESKVQASITA